MSLIDELLETRVLEIAATVRKGLHWSFVDEVSNLYGVSRAKLLRVLHIPASAFYSCRREDSLLARAHGDNLVRLILLYQDAVKLGLDSPRIFHAMYDELDGQTLFDYVDTYVGTHLVQLVMVQLSLNR